MPPPGRWTSFADLPWPSGHHPPSAAVLFYDLFQLQTFTQRLAAGLPPAAAAAEEATEEEWEAVEAAVQALEGQLGAPADAFVR